MMKTITQLIVHRRGMHYWTGTLLFVFAMMMFPEKSYSQCIDNAKAACESGTPIVVQLDENDVFRVRVFGDFYDSAPAMCTRGDFKAEVWDVNQDSLLENFNTTGPNFRHNNACQYVGKNLKAELYYDDGITRALVCERKVILLPQIECADTTLFCNHPVFESVQDESVLPLLLSCDDFDPPALDLEIIDEFWNDNMSMDTLFRIWEVRANNGKGVVTCTDTIVKEAIPIAEIIFPEDDTISCEVWDGTAPDPVLSGRPYLIVNPGPDQDTVFLDVGEYAHCVAVSYKDEAWGRFDCEVEKYQRIWKVRTDEGIAKDTQMITVLDSLGPEAEFQFAPIDSMDADIDGEIVRVPIYRISTGGHECESDGNLPFLYASDACSGVAKIIATATDQDGIVRSLTNGGPFTGFEEGKYLVKYTAADSCWNESEYYVWIQVTDLINPVVSLGDEYTISLNDQITWLDLQELATHHLTDNCGIGLVVGRRLSDYATACGADDPESEVGMYREKYRMWLADDGWDCADQIDVDEGWLDKIPFCCEDLGSEIMIEIRVFDESCNESRGMTLMIPVNKGGATIYKRLPDVALACESWNTHYSALITDDTQPNNLNLDSLDKYFGTYQPFEQGGNNTPTIWVEDLTCSVVNDKLVTFEKLIKIHDGVLRAACAGTLTQEAELTFDDGCNTFTITRRFLIEGSVVATQKISTEIRCPFMHDLFEYPANRDTMITIADIDILKDPAYWVGNRFNLVTEGPVYVGSDCRVIAIGYVDKLMDMISNSHPDQADAVIVRTWCMADWCTSDLGPDWKSSIGNYGIITWTQNIKIFVDPDNPDVAIEKPDEDEITDGVINPPKATDGTPNAKDKYIVKGSIRTEDALNVNNVTVQVNAADHDEEMLTNESGSFEMEVEKGSRLKIKPVKKGGLGNGLSTLDLILIQRHLLNKKRITSPYKLIAADVNNDRKLSPADVLFLRRVILNKMDGLSEAESWKFVDANYTFINQKASYSEAYPTVLDIEYLNKDLNSEFIAIKLGDINQSANVSRSSDRSNHPVTFLNVEDKRLAPGQNVDVKLRISEHVDMAGMQFALRVDPSSADVLEVYSDQIPLSKDQWTVENGVIRLSYSDTQGSTLKNGDPVVTVKLRAQKDVFLRDILSFNSNAITPELYDESDAIQSLGLAFTSAGERLFTVHQNRPNPVRGEAIIDYDLDQDAQVYLQVHDVTGKLIHTDQADAVKGRNQFWIHTGQLQAGVMYYTITDGQHRATRKMVVIK